MPVCCRGLKGECGRRQPFDQAGVVKVFFGVGDRIGVLSETLPALVDDGFPDALTNDDAD